MKNKKVILGMSGGVDSSVAALLLQKQGYEVIGFFMNASPSGKPRWPSTIKWPDEEKTLREICGKLGIRLIVKDCEEGYEKNVIKPMFDSYARGLTPNPDVLCNNVGKFPSLLKIAKQEGASFIATGHYARVRKGKKGFGLLRAKDDGKDQSYFLVGLGQKYLRKVIFPIGELTKTEVRKLAEKAGFPNFDKRSSRGVCYLGKIDMKSFLRQRIKEKPGKVLSPEGWVVGSHLGVMFFTIGERVGERNGFIIDGGYRKKNPGKLFIAGKTKKNEIIIAPEFHLALRTKRIFIRHFGLVNKVDFPKSGLMARIRHLGKLVSGKLERGGKGFCFVFDKGQEGVAEGQMIVLYKGERMIGGGEIRL
jgi:tRNA-uridine 2-sulfurtransferase